MRAKTVPNVDAEELDRELLADDGFMKLMPAQVLLGYGLETLQAWALQRARYCFPTVELVEWLRERIAGRSAIEIGAGMGDLGHHQGIRMTDSAMQVTNPAAVPFIQAMGQRATDPPPEVERLDAEAAVAKYQPEVVVAAWLTEKWHENNTKGNMFGPEEIRLVRACTTYIFVGNTLVHSGKRIFRLKHRQYKPTWLVSRAFEQEKNAIWQWGR